ncbi:MAG: hypothetical protein H0U03_00080 [Actinobacteria bacterium]|nr:hypothetical protein [Actinomycetota bacterium]
MRTFLSSPRRRRRFGWLGAAALGVTAIVAGLTYSHSLSKPEAAGPTSADGWAPPAVEKRVRLTEQNRLDALTVASEFVETAVARKRIAESWDLIVPSMKQGYTRKTWALGDIPVVPFPVHTARWRLDYSFRNSVGLKVALFPKPGSDVRAAVFNLDLRVISRGPRRGWLVESWAPNALESASMGGGQPMSVTGLPNLSAKGTSGTSRLSATWLLVPAGIFSLVLLIPLAIGINGWHRGARARREYARARSRV